MAREELAVQTVSRAGLEATYTAAQADGNKFVNDGMMWATVKNGATDCIVTVLTAVTVDGKAVADDTVTVTANEERDIGPFPPSIYNQPDGMVYFDYNSVANVTIAAKRLGS